MSRKPRKADKKEKKGKKAKKVKSEQKSDEDKDEGRNEDFISQEEYQQVIEQEFIFQKLRLDNFAILLYLVDINDPEVKQCFQQHLLANKEGMADQINLVAQLDEKTEETFQALVEKYLAEDEQGVVRQMRLAKDEQYLSIFKIVINQGPALFNIDYLMQNLKIFAQNQLHKLSEDLCNSKSMLYGSSQMQDQSRSHTANLDKDQLEQVFIGILYSHYKGNEVKENFLREQF